MVQFLVEHGACIYATTIRDNETAAEKCEEEEENYATCSQYLLCKFRVGGKNPV
jgi:apoptosis-stimulating of p53 protein 1